MLKAGQAQGPILSMPKALIKEYRKTEAATFLVCPEPLSVESRLLLEV